MDDFLGTFGLVTEAQGLLLAAHWCSSEVCNGGLHQFFYNPTGVLAPEAIRGFQLIGVPEAARVVQQAVSMFEHPFPRDRKERIQQLEDLVRPGSSRAQWDPFYALDNKFYEATGTAEFASQADVFVRQHMDLFFSGT